MVVLVHLDTNSSRSKGVSRRSGKTRVRLFKSQGYLLTYLLPVLVWAYDSDLRMLSGATGVSLIVQNWPGEKHMLQCLYLSDSNMPRETLVS